MRVRFGFVAMALSLTNASPSKTMTYKTFQSIADREAALQKATNIAQQNLVNTLRILRHARASGVYLYRFSSKLIPLFGHPETRDFDFIGRLQSHFLDIGRFVADHRMRVSFHPDHFTLLNTPKEDVLAQSIHDLSNHVRMLEAMGLPESPSLVLHVGGAYNDKASAMQRFVDNWARVPVAVQERIMLENDDKTYTAHETQELCGKVGVPHVLDIHHHACNHEDGVSLSDVIPTFLQSWADTGLPPKSHVSSPKSEKDFRAHADFLNPHDLLPFLDLVREFNVDLDVMLEAKMKDEALFALSKALEKEDYIHVLEAGVIEYRP
ncbi:UV DNA damage repair endonuclease UvsE [Alicyclobacillus ferrooxydans]|uniref:UV damage repair endonuclease UvdE n=1 Tax=Alicyclobacillus ferrooxydans TaxID=471514 RepID=A0A0P9GU30_9BACL|nr:UV DNA damage repair endonuclease UvsE [Alicyclobacillus ferrooxydans]KPV44748.1 hypothetical protein AN477_05500 [Alicyclobacillus ferrooxydans]